MAKNEVAIIVAGGKGLRLRGNIPKQFLALEGLPILMHTVGVFHAYDPSMPVILVLPAADFSLWKSLCQEHRFTLPVTLVEGGVTRFQSVKNGLNKVTGPGFVAVHDGVRPLVTPEIIAASFDVARRHRSAVASVPLKESIRELKDGHAGTSASETAHLPQESTGHSVALDRTKFRLMQTPQTFDIELLRAAYALPEEETLTDDASVAERSGYTITLFEGSYENIKITTPEDLVVAGALLRARQK